MTTETKLKPIPCPQLWCGRCVRSVVDFECKHEADLRAKLEKVSSALVDHEQVGANTWSDAVAIATEVLKGKS